MILSNYLWMRNHQNNAGPLQCEPNFFSVQFKLSSTVFKSFHDPDEPKLEFNDCNTVSYCPNGQDQFYFDSHGVTFDFEDFCDLCRMPVFTDLFMSDLETMFNRYKPQTLSSFRRPAAFDQMPPPPPPPSAACLDIDVETVDEPNTGKYGLRKRLYINNNNINNNNTDGIESGTEVSSQMMSE